MTEPTYHRTVFMSVPGGSAARYLVKSDIPATLQEGGARIVALVPTGADGALVEDFVDGELIRAPLRKPRRELRPDEAVWRRTARVQVRRLRRFALDCRSNERAREKYEQYRRMVAPHGRRSADLALNVLTHGLWRSRALRRLLLALDKRLTRYTLHADLFERYRPDLVVAGGLGYFEYDEALLREAEDRGIRTAVLIHAWDNPSTKGYRGADADLVVAWSSNMRDQLARYQDVPPERIEVGGVPHWDAYLRPGSLPDRAAIFEHFGLDPDRRLLVYATPPPNRAVLGGGYHAGAQVARWIAARVEEGAFGSGVQLLIRLHPKYGREGFVEGPEFAEIAERYPSTSVNRPDVASEQVLDSLTDGDRLMLGGLIEHCDVLINFWSTTTLEACVLDTPVVIAHVNTPGGGGEALSDWQQFAHLRALTASGAARVADSTDELVAHVRAYLADPTLDSAQRRTVAGLECGPLDGAAGRRVGGMLLRELGLQAGEQSVVE